MPDYIPDSDAEFDAWLDNFTSTLGKEKTNLKLSDADLNELTEAKADWTAKLADYNAKHSAAEAATQAKNGARQRVKAAVRARARAIQADAGVSDATRAALGLTVSDTTRTATPAPTTRPVAQVDTSQRLRHTISFTDEQTPTSRRKPDGVRGCEIWVKVGDPAPTGPDQLRFLALDTATPYVVEYDGADAGKTAHYWLRWLSTRGEPGPWSQTVSATITS